MDLQRKFFVNEIFQLTLISPAREKTFRWAESLTADTSAYGLFQPLPLVFKPLENPGAVDVKPEVIAVRWITLDLDFCTADINILAFVEVV